MDEWSVVQFTFNWYNPMNPSASYQAVLFDPNTLALVPYYASQASVPIGTNYYIVGSVDYNQFVADCLVNPKAVYKVVLYGPQGGGNYTEPILIEHTDANGNSVSKWVLPIDYYSISQRQSQIAVMDFGDKPIILDVTSRVLVTIPPLYPITMTLIHGDMPLSDMLSGNANGIEFSESLLRGDVLYAREQVENVGIDVPIIKLKPM